MHRGRPFYWGLNMTDEIARLLEDATARLEAAQDLRALDEARVAVLGARGTLRLAVRSVGSIPAERRKEFGAAANVAIQSATSVFEARRFVLEGAALDARLAAERQDMSLPAAPIPAGGIHPINRTIEELTAIFGAMDFSVVEGPDIEGDWYNFAALNIPDHHPARQDQDTFYMPDSGPDGRPLVLRTQTSPLQIRTMIGQAPPIRIIAPGRTYRADHDATHSPMFHQVEGLVIDRDITLGHLKGCLTDFLRAFFGIADLPVRFRSSYFPFTEPSMEVDVGWNRKSGELGAGGAKGQDWLEILGSGMVHPRVLANCGLDPREWQGFAFGMGIERITMLKHGIPDLRPFFEGDVRWLRHYGSNPLQPASLHEGV